MARADLAKELYEMIYKASTLTMPNFGGSFGMYGAQEPIASELLKATGELLGALKNGSASNESFDTYLALCRVAEASNVLATKSLDRVHDIIDELRKEI